MYYTGPIFNGHMCLDKVPATTKSHILHYLFATPLLGGHMTGENIPI